MNELEQLQAEFVKTASYEGIDLNDFSDQEVEQAFYEWADGGEDEVTQEDIEYIHEKQAAAYEYLTDVGYLEGGYSEGGIGGLMSKTASADVMPQLFENYLGENYGVSSDQLEEAQALTEYDNFLDMAVKEASELAEYAEDSVHAEEMGRIAGQAHFDTFNKLASYNGYEQYKEAQKWDAGSSSSPFVADTGPMIGDGTSFRMNKKQSKVSRKANRKKVMGMNKATNTGLTINPQALPTNAVDHRAGGRVIDQVVPGGTMSSSIPDMYTPNPLAGKKSLWQKAKGLSGGKKALIAGGLGLAAAGAGVYAYNKGKQNKQAGDYVAERANEFAHMGKEASYDGSDFDNEALMLLEEHGYDVSPLFY